MEIDVEYLQRCMFNNAPLVSTADFHVPEYHIFPDDDKTGFSHLTGNKTYNWKGFTG